MKQKLNCIMVIDDDEPTNFISTMLFEEADCTRHLEILESGIKALDYLNKALPAGDARDRRVVPDLLFVDINMPRMNGWEFLEAYRKLGNDRLSKTVIIMLTTSLNPDDRRLAAEIPELAGFENKPLTREKIQRIIQTYFSRS